MIVPVSRLHEEKANGFSITISVYSLHPDSSHHYRFTKPSVMSGEDLKAGKKVGIQIGLTGLMIYFSPAVFTISFLTLSNGTP